jgi:hypothetical protein
MYRACASDTHLHVETHARMHERLNVHAAKFRANTYTNDMPYDAQEFARNMLREQEEAVSPAPSPALRRASKLDSSLGELDGPSLFEEPPLDDSQDEGESPFGAFGVFRAGLPSGFENRALT